MLHTSKLSCSVTKFSHKRTSRTIKGVFTPVGIRQALKKEWMWYILGLVRKILFTVTYCIDPPSTVICIVVAIWEKREWKRENGRVKERKWEKTLQKGFFLSLSKIKMSALIAMQPLWHPLLLLVTSQLSVEMIATIIHSAVYILSLPLHIATHTSGAYILEVHFNLA